MAIVSQSVPSSATPTLLLPDASPYARAWVAITNQGASNVWYSVDGSADVTIGSGAKPGILLPASTTHFFSRNDAMASSNTGPIYVVQQSGAAVTVSAQYL